MPDVTLTRTTTGPVRPGGEGSGAAARATGL